MDSSDIRFFGKVFQALNARRAFCFTFFAHFDDMRLKQRTDIHEIMGIAIFIFIFLIPLFYLSDGTLKLTSCFEKPKNMIN